MKKQDPIDPTGGQVVNIADARVRRQKPKAPQPVMPETPIGLGLPDLTDMSAIIAVAFGLMSVGDPDLKQMRKGLHKDLGKKQRTTIHKFVKGLLKHLLKHLGPEDTRRVLVKASEVLNEAASAMPQKPANEP